MTLWTPPTRTRTPDPGHDGVVFDFFVFEGDIERDHLARVRNPLIEEERVYGSPWPDLVDRFVAHNLIVTTGKDKLMRQLFGLTTAPLNTTGVGTDSTAAAVTQTKLNPSVAGSVSLVAFDSGYPTYASPTITVQTTYGTAVANFSWNEVGLFDGTTNGTSILFDRATFGPFAKSSSVSIIVVGQISQA